MVPYIIRYYGTLYYKAYNDALSDFTDFGDMTSHQTQFNFDDYVEDWLQQYLI